MSAQPNPSWELLDAILHRICVGEALCAVAEAQALAGELHMAWRCIQAVETILDEGTRFASSPAARAGTQELEECLRSLRHRWRNAETVLKLLE